METDNPYDLAKALMEIDGVTGVRASHNRITVAHAPEDRFVEKIPEQLHEDMFEIMDETNWSSEYSDADRNAEKHDWLGGRGHDPVTDPVDQPAGYELQYHFV